MSTIPQNPRARTVLVIILILLPLAMTIVFKYASALRESQPISSLAILHPKLIGPSEFTYLENDIAKRLHETLAEIPGLQVRNLSPDDITHNGSNLVNAANSLGVGAMVVPVLTIDGGLMQLNLQVVDTGTGKVIFNTPFQSSIDNYSGMMRAAGTTLKRALP